MHEWTWAVVYDDGSEHFEDEFDGFASVEINRVRTLVVMLNDGEQAKQYVVAIRDGMRPIFFRRKRQLKINDETSPIPIEYLNENGELARTEYLFATAFGWQKTVNGRNVKSLTWLLHDGSVAVTDCDLDKLGGP